MHLQIHGEQYSSLLLADCASCVDRPEFTDYHYNDGIASVHWNPPRCPGLLITAYELEYLEGCNQSTTEVLLITDQKVSVNGLTSNSIYFFRVRAKFNNMDMFSEHSGCLRAYTSSPRSSEF